MSLTMLALRICAVEALKAGGTLVGDNVLDSEIAALDHTVDGQLTSDQRLPFIAVYSEASTANDLGQVGLRQNGGVDLAFNFGVSMAMVDTDTATGETVTGLGLPATDAQFEAELDIIGAQICRVLHDDANPWAVVFREFVTAFSAKQEHRSSSSAEGLRLAAGQIKVTVQAMADPVAGAQLAAGGPWDLFQQQLQAEMHHLAPVVAQLLSQTSVGAYPDYQKLSGMSASAEEDLSLRPVPGLGEDVDITDPQSAAVPA